MTTEELEILIEELTALPLETEWVEFKTGLIKEYEGARMYIPFWAG